MTEPNLDIWTSFFLFASAQGFFLITLLLKKGGKDNALLAVITLLFSITLVEYVFFWSGYRLMFPHFSGISGPFYFLYGPLLYFFIQSQFKEVHTFSFKNLIHFVPFLICVSYNSPYYLSSAEVKLSIMNGTLPLTSIQILISRLVPLLQLFSLVIYSIIVFRFFNQRKGSLKVSTTRLKRINYAFALFVISFGSYYLMVYSIGYVLKYDYAISISMSFFIYYIGYSWFTDQPKAVGESKTVKYQNSRLSLAEFQDLSRKLNTLMSSEKMFLMRDLNLEKLSGYVGAPKHHLSQVLNNYLEKSFSEFVNEFRVEEAKNLLESEELTLNMNGVASESGFNTKASFYNAFKKYTGLTPIQHREKWLTESVKSD